MSTSSATDAWAVGTKCLPSCRQTSTLARHWNGTRWPEVASPNPGPKGNTLTDVTDVSPADAWAVGYFGNSTCAFAATLILHWNGTAWSVTSG